jgi:hypothetical protein
MADNLSRIVIGDLADDDVHNLQLRPDGLENWARFHESRLVGMEGIEDDGPI